MRKPIATSPSEGGGRKSGKKHRTLPVFPISIWAHLLTGAMSNPCLSSGETGGFLWHPVRHTAAHRTKFLEKIKLQPTQDSPSPARNRHCQEWGSQHCCKQQAYLVLVAFLRESAINWLSLCFTAGQQRQRSAQGLKERPDPSTGAGAVSPINEQVALKKWMPCF